MRKLLLASVALLGATGIAQAQMNLNTSPTPSVPGANAPANGGLSGGTSKPAGLAPGQIIVRMNGKFNWYAGFLADGDQNASYYVNSATAPTTASWFSSSTNSIAVSAKNNQGVSFASYIRLYPGFDGMAANGLRYGVSAEIRQENAGRSGGGAASSISASNNTRGALYWRRAFGYIAGDSWGTLRFGSGDGPATLFMTGASYVNEGGWNGDLPSMLTGGGPAWPFADVGTIYTTNSITYLSPQMAGFDLGLRYAPTSNAMSNVNGCALNLASVGCDRLWSVSSSTSTSEQNRQHDFFEAMVRYRGNFSGVGIAAYGGWMGSSTINNNVSASSQRKVEGQNIGVGGAQISYAGFAVGGMIQAGRYGRGFAQINETADDSVAWLVGASYTTGPIIVGGHYFQFTHAGSYIAPGTQGATTDVGKQQRERGLALGGTYAVAPGLSVFLSYLWGDRNQDGVNLLTGQSSGDSQFYKNTVTVQAISLGTQLRW